MGLERCTFWDDLATEHRDWLSSFHPQYLRNWEKVLNAEYEAGLCEAAVRRLLQNHSISVEPNEDLTGSQQQPDFRCTSPDGKFFVEVACLLIDNVTKETGLPHPQETGPRCYGGLNDLIFKTCKGKTPQCSGMTEPTLVAIGTFHVHAAHACFNKRFANMLLTGETSITFWVDTRIGEAVGDTFQSTQLYSAAFLRPENKQIADARHPISGILLCRVCSEPPTALGVLHPDAVRPFNRQLLPGIDFGEVQINRTTGHLGTTWSGSDD
jgi:hypothetical protein